MTRGHSEAEAGEVQRQPASGYGWASQRTQMTHGTAAAALTEEELDAMMAEFSKEDQVASKTMARMLVEKWLMKMKWYNPRRDDSDPHKPDLSKAWAYYEHITLARRFVGDQTTEHTLQRAEPGETSETELYSPLTTPESALNEWGIGVGIYFTTVRTMAVILLIAGLINIPNIFYYRSEAYNGPGGQGDVDFTLQGSMICTNREWVLCTEGCEQSRWGSDSGQDRWAMATDGSMRIFVQRTLCVGAQLAQGMINWASLLFMIICIVLLSLYQKKREIRFDEDKSTSTDYSVKVSNPPQEYDPEKWRDFFEQFSEKQVTFVTVALDNEPLLWALYMRRIFRDKLRLLLPRGTDLDNAEEVSREVEAHIVYRESMEKGCLEKIFGCLVVPILKMPPFYMYIPAEVLVERIEEWTKKVKELQKLKYKVTQVFVTFETEEGQRSALAALKVGKLDLWRQNKNAVAPSAFFQGRVLKVEEPAEANAIRWMYLHVTPLRKYLQRLVTLSITIGLIALSGFVINRARMANSILFSICVPAFNFLVPNVIKLLLLLERHGNEGSLQKSMYLKITLFRWTNAAILTKIITPFPDSLGNQRLDLLTSIDGVLIAEMVFTPLMRLADLFGVFRKHILAPRAPTQELMNLSFTGTIYNLGERYTDFTKVVFLVLFYSALNPNAFFIGFATLIIQYYVDKFCLMRIWASAPFIGTQLAVFNRRYFLSATLLAFAIVSSYAFAEFPYDNLCDDTSGAGNGAGNDIPVEFGNSTTGTLSVSGENSPTKFCHQSFLRLPGFGFPAIPSKQPPGGEWMKGSQTTLTRIYGWTSLAALVVWCVVLFGGVIISFIRSLFRGTFKPAGVDQKIDFSTVQEIDAYIPQIRAPGFLFNFLAADIDEIDQNLIGWNDPHRSYDYWNLIYDVPYPGMKRTKRIVENTRQNTAVADHEDYEAREVTTARNAPQHPIFSIVKHYPPEWAKKAKEQEG